MEQKFKPIKFDELQLSMADMRKIAEGAKLFMQPDIEDETQTTTAPAELVSPRPLRES